MVHPYASPLNSQECRSFTTFTYSHLAIYLTIICLSILGRVVFARWTLHWVYMFWKERTSQGMCLIENKDIQCITRRLNSISYLWKALSNCFINDCIQQLSVKDSDVITVQTKPSHMQAMIRSLLQPQGKGYKPWPNVAWFQHLSCFKVSKTAAKAVQA